MTVDPLSNYLKMYRKRSGLSQRELGYLLGCKTGSRVSRYEGATRHPSFETALAYEVIFRVALDALYRGEHDALSAVVRKRAQSLFRRLDAKKEFTPAIKRKLDFLTDIIYPTDSKHL